MGIGNKPHIDLAPSSGNTIMNRSVASHHHSNQTTAQAATNTGVKQTGTRISTASTDGQINRRRPHSVVSSNASSCTSWSSNSSTTSSSTTSSSSPMLLGLSSWQTSKQAAGEQRRYATLPSMTSCGQLPMAYRDFHSIAEVVEDEGTPGE